MGYPYSTKALEELHPDGWANIAPQSVWVSELIPTQDCVVIDRLQHLLDGGEPETGDPYAHVVAHDGRLFVHDGHHRYILALVKGRSTMLSRVVAAESPE